MRTWNLKSGDPLVLTLAADVRLGPTDYCNDHIWELTLGGGEPPALGLYTTFGLRARILRLFPRFTEGDTILSDPVAFNRSPAIHVFTPNYLRLTYAPFSDIEVIAEYWVPESDAVAGRLRITNQGTVPRQLRLEWDALLIPAEEGQRMAPLEIGKVMVLAGQTGNLAPVVFLTGGAEVVTSPYPALTLPIDLAGGASRQLSWAEAALSDAQASFELARQITTRNWDAECARVELLNAGQIEVHTGDPDWDTAFAFAQKTAFSLFLGPTAALPCASFVLTRQPDQGYSPRGDGSDYNHLWNGQTSLEAYYLINLLLPAAPHLAQGLVRNFLSTQNQDGEVDWKPGLGGQRGQLLATPLLACLAWRIYQVTEDRHFLEETFPLLLNSLLAWFLPQHDRDGDGIPEWDHAMQTGFEDHPLFAHWHTWTQGIDITTAESPSLCAFLYRECQALIRIAQLLDRSEPLLALQAHADNLKAAVEASWEEASVSYHYWDRDTHRSTPWKSLGERYGSGDISIHQDFAFPLRLLARIQTDSGPGGRVHIFIRGSGPTGQHLVEHIPNERLHWYLGMASVTSERVYTTLEDIEIQGADETDRITLQSAGYIGLDHTLFLPLWANIPGKERAQALVRQTITNPDRFWQLYGIRACSDPPITSDQTYTCQSVYLPWNALIGEGLVAYGYRTEAADLVVRLMKAIIQNLKNNRSFLRYYHAETGQGLGERNALNGLAPLGLFLDVLGVKLISPRRVELTGFNPFPWPITVKYRGLTVLRQSERTAVIFPDGQTITVEGSEPRIVALE
jgi:hypothetical protein